MANSNEKISIIVPVYNEEKTVGKVVKALKSLNLGIAKEIVIVDDCSRDNTKSTLLRLKSQDNELNIFFHDKNKGKGLAIKTGLEHVSGSIIAIQDADLEYNMENLRELIQPILRNETKVVYGSRFLKKNKKGYFSFYLGNRFLSFVTSILYFKWITDMETCYKVFRREILDGIQLKCSRFDFEPEITSKILKKGYSIKELPIEYNPRNKSEGKHITVKDGLIALKYLVKYRFFD